MERESYLGKKFRIPIPSLMRTLPPVLMLQDPAIAFRTNLYFWNGIKEGGDLTDLRKGIYNIIELGPEMLFDTPGYTRLHLMAARTQLTIGNYQKEDLTFPVTTDRLKKIN
jgi:hypothetical protein